MGMTFESLAGTDRCRPNFFLLGAGRCGSTTLYHMLRQHPEVFMPAVKEPSFFCSYFQVIKDPARYLQLFDGACGRPAVGEASHVYLSNPESPEVIHGLFPEARFILIFRNPAERAHSLYGWMRRAGLEPLPTFEEALEAEERRLADPEFFRNCPHYFWNFMYASSSCYDVQWKRWLRFYPRERFFALGLKELVEDPARWMARIFRFLGVDDTFLPRDGHLNSIDAPPMAEETRRRLDERFRGTIAATNALAGRDLRLC